MTVAVGAEGVAGASAGPGQSQAAGLLGKANGAGQAGALGAHSSESFRAGLQALLASLGAGAEGSSNLGTEAEGSDASNENALAADGQKAAAQRLSALVASPSSSNSRPAGQDGFAAQSANVTTSVNRTPLAANAGSIIAASLSAENTGKRQPGKVQSPDSGTGERSHHNDVSKSSKHALDSDASASLQTATAAIAIPLTTPVPRAANLSPNFSQANGTTETPSPSAPRSDHRSDAATKDVGAIGGQKSTALAISDPTSVNTSQRENLDGNDVSAATNSATEGTQTTHAGRTPIEDATPAIVQSQTGGASTAEADATLARADGQDQRSAIADAAAARHSQSQAATRGAAKVSLSAGGQHSSQAGANTAYGSGSVESSAHGRQPGGQSSGFTLDSSAIARDLGGPTSSGSGTMAGGLSGGSASTSTRETFAALDAETAPSTPIWMHAGAQRAEAGFQDPALGWVGVRADMSGTGIHAALVPGSAEAAQALGGHLAGLNSYLSEQRSPVETLTLAAPQDRSVDAGADGQTNQGMGQDMGQGTSQDQNHGAGQHAGPIAEPAAIAGTQASSLARPALTAAELSSGNIATQSTLSGGTHISVMA